MEQVRATPEKKTDAGGRHGRLLYVANLRWTMILLAISMHAADTYGPFGNGYFVERLPVTAIETLVFGAWQMYLQSFFMGPLLLPGLHGVSLAGALPSFATGGLAASCAAGENMGRDRLKTARNRQ